MNLYKVIRKKATSDVEIMIIAKSEIEAKVIASVYESCSINEFTKVECNPLNQSQVISRKEKFNI